MTYNQAKANAFDVVLIGDAAVELNNKLADWHQAQLPGAKEPR
jgi:hypothetical protein